MKPFQWIILILFSASLGACAWFIHRKHQEEGKPVVTFLSPTECQGNHGVWRWAAKTDADPVPLDTFDADFGWLTIIQQTSIANMASWPVPDGPFDKTTPRAGRELQWFQLTATVVLVKAEDDGDLHVQLADGDGPQVVVEVPLGEPWSTIREEVFSWADVTFPCKPHELALKRHPVIRVTGKAFFDAIHQGDVPNRRSYDANVTVLELHPIHRLEVIE